MMRRESEWQQLQTEYALARVVHQLATEAVDRPSHSVDTLAAALLFERQARQNLAELRRRMHRFRPLRYGRLSSRRRAAQELRT
jgi:L-serine deaminase